MPSFGNNSTHSRSSSCSCHLNTVGDPNNLSCYQHNDNDSDNENENKNGNDNDNDNGNDNAATAACNSEQDAAAVLGYTQVIWDNESGKEKQPASAKKYWAQLTDAEKAAAVVLGYTGGTWDGKGGKPESANKYWAELTSCGRSRAITHTHTVF